MWLEFLGRPKMRRVFMTEARIFVDMKLWRIGKWTCAINHQCVGESKSLFFLQCIYRHPSPGAPPRPTLCIYTLGFLRWLPRWLSGFLGQFQFMPLVPASLFITPSFTLKSVPVWTFHYKITLFMEVGKWRWHCCQQWVSLFVLVLIRNFLSLSWDGFTDFPKCSGKLWQACNVHGIACSCTAWALDGVWLTVTLGK